MNVTFNPEYKKQRSMPVKVGNVYLGRNDIMRVCLAVVERDRWDKPWNNVLIASVNVMGKIRGASMSPERYVSDHMTLVGTVEGMVPIEFEFEGRE
jgi:hypothetical protein